MKNSISKLIDQQLFKWVDQLKLTAQYSQLTAQLETIPEQYSKYINQAIIYILSFFPLLILLSMGIYYMIAQGTISDKRELLHQLIETNNLAAQVQVYERGLVGRLNIGQIGDMTNEMSRIASQQGIENSSISVEDFKTESIGGLNKSEATIKLSNLNTPALIGLLRVLAVNEKFKINHLSFKRTTDSITGDISLLHFGRVEEL